MKRLLTILLCAVLLIGTMPMTALAEEATAATMRLEKCEGTVNVKNASGKTLKITEKMRLYNGYEITTSQKSYAYISLDGTKAVKLDASTKVSVTKAGKKLEILVSSGKLLFNVSAPLENDESLEIRTSTSLTGVRGTIGYVEVTSPIESVLTILEGVTEVTTVNPTTGEKSVTQVSSGQQLSSLITPEEGSETITVVVTDIAPEDIPGFVLTYVAENPEVQERIEENSELEIQVVVASAQEIQKLEEYESEKQEKEIQQQLNELTTDDVDPLFENTSPTPPNIGNLPLPDEPTPDEPTPDEPTPDEPTPDEPTIYTVSFEMNGHGTPIDPQTVNHGSTVSEPTAPTVEGFTFGGWFKDVAFTTPWDFETDTVTSDTTIYAKWTINSYTVSFEMNGHGTPIDPQTVNHGSTVSEPTASTVEGFTFGGWFKDVAFTTPWDFETDTVTSDTTIYAKWTINSYTVSFEMNGHGTPIDPQTVNHGSTVTRPADPTAAGFSFGGWFKDAALTTLWHFDTDTVTADTVTANTKLYAKWTEIPTTTQLDNPTAEQLKAALAEAGASADINTVIVTNANLQLDSALTVPAGETLQINSGSITNNSTLTIRGTMTTATGTQLINDSQIDILSTNSLHVAGTLINQNTGTINVGVIKEDLSTTPGLLEITVGGNLINYGQITLGGSDLVNNGVVSNSGTIAINGNVGGQFINNPNAKFENNGEFGNTMLTDIGRLIFWNTVAAGTFVNEGTYEDARTDTLRAIVTIDTSVLYVGPIADLAEWPEGSTVKLIGGTSGSLSANCNYSEQGDSLFLIENKGVILDLNGRTLSTSSAPLTVGGTYYEDTIQASVTFDASLTVVDSAGGGAITSTSWRTLVNFGEFILESGTINNDNGIAIYPHGTGTTTINGGSVTGKNAISIAGISGSSNAITINGGTITGSESAINNAGGGLLTINGGTITGEKNVLIHNGSVKFTGGFLCAPSTDILDNMGLELPAESCATDTDGNYTYTVDLSQEPSIWKLTNPTEDQFSRVLGKSYVTTIQVYDAALTLTDNYLISGPQSLWLHSGAITIDTDASLEVAGSFYVQSSMKNRGTLMVTSWPVDDATRSIGQLELQGTLHNMGTIYIGTDDYRYGNFNCDSAVGGQLDNMGTFLNFACTVGGQGPYIEVTCLKVSDDGTSEYPTIYLGKADGTNWILPDSSEYFVTFHELNGTTMYLPDTISGVNVTLNADDQSQTINLSVKDTGTLTLESGARLNIADNWSSDYDFSTPLFAFDGDIVIDSNAAMKANFTTFTGSSGQPVISVIGDTAYQGDPVIALELVACTVTQTENAFAIDVQDAYVRITGISSEDLSNSKNAEITSKGHGILANEGSMVELVSLDLEADGVGLDLACSTMLTDEGSYVNNSTITAGKTALITSNVDSTISVSNCQLTSTSDAAIINSGSQLTLDSCTVTSEAAEGIRNSGFIRIFSSYDNRSNEVYGATYALYNTGSVESEYSNNLFVLTSASGRYTVFSDTSALTEPIVTLYGIFKAKTVDQIFSEEVASEDDKPYEEFDDTQTEILYYVIQR